METPKTTVLTRGQRGFSGGLRHKQKRERLDRIKSAARELFLEKGYDRTTLRMIGKRAKVGAGTILRYVDDKRALLYLLFNEDHQHVTEQALAAMKTKRRFLDRTIAGFRPFYQYYGQHPELSRDILREATFYKPKWPSDTSAGEAAHRAIARLRDDVEAARDRGEITSDVDDGTITWLIFEIYQMEALRWLASENSSIEAGLRQLRKVLGALLDGLR
jgi:AcrR family transcriptional regulator